MAYIKFINVSGYHEADVIPSGNIVTLKFVNEPIVCENGFNLYLDPEGKKDIGGKAYRKFKTVYRNDEETAKYNGYQLSNDHSHYVPPAPVLKDVVVGITWDDCDDELKERPASVDVTVIHNGESEVLTLSAENEWKHTYSQVPAEDTFVVNAPEVVNYTMQISGTTITYHTDVPQPEPISINELADSVLEVTGEVADMSKSVAENSDAILELYEMISQ